MSDAIDTLGDNAAADLTMRVKRRVEILAQREELKEDEKRFKAADKAAGYDEKALAKVVKDLTADPEKHAGEPIGHADDGKSAHLRSLN